MDIPCRNQLDGLSRFRELFMYKDQCSQIEAGYDAAKRALDAAKPKSERAKQLKSVLGFLGKPGEANGVAVTFGKLDTGTPAVTYDAAGNMTDDGLGLGNAYTYDAENRIITAANGYTASYVYDAFGHRVRAVVNGENRDFLYDLDGRTIDQLTNGTLTRTEAYAGSMHIATYVNSTTEFDNSDWLSTVRVRSNVAGNQIESCTSLPFGEDLTCTGTEDSPLHFTGKEHDWESGNDFFGARYYGETMGRFVTPDPDQESGIDNMGNPQMWNGYAYVGNNPLNTTDPDGRSVYICVGGSASEGGTCTTVSDDAYNLAQQQDQYNHAPSLDQLKDSGQQGNITDANGNAVGTVQYSPDDPKGAPVEGISPEGEKILAGYAMGGIINRIGGALFGTVAGWFGRGAGGAVGQTAGQLGLRAGGTIERIFQTSAGPVQVYCEVTAEGGTAVVKDLAIFPANSEGALNVGYTQMRQGLGAIQGELKDAGFTEMRVENAYRISGANPGRSTTFTVRLK
jgi:RHS repeat-associated protein